MDDVTCLHSFVYSTCVSQVAPYPMIPSVVQNGLEHTRGISALPNPELGFPSVAGNRFSDQNAVDKLHGTAIISPRNWR